MDLSIIIVNYRGWKRLKECLDPLAAYKKTGFTYEVIIVDNNSDDGKLAEFKNAYPGFIFIMNSVNGGFANGCNLGSKSAKGEFFLFLNPDTVAPEEEVEKLLLRAKANPSDYISSCRQVNEKGKESKAYGIFPGFGTLTGIERAIFRAIMKKKTAAKETAKNNRINPDWVSGSVIMVKGEIFRNLEGFDEDFWMYFEDMDICRRARDMNGEIAYYTDITIQHNHGGSSRINPRIKSLTKTEVLISNHLYIAKHKSGAGRFLIQLYLVLNNLVSSILTALPGLILFPVPGLFVKARIFFRLMGYYGGALGRMSWISPRSVRFNKNA